MKADLLIRGGRIIDPQSKLDVVGDVYIRDGLIESVRPGGGLSVPEGTAVVEARGLIVSPGFVDLHCHLREPGFEEKETIATGTKAAAAGGFTTVCCMPNTSPAIDTRATVEFVRERARTTGIIRVLPIAAVTMSRAGKVLVEMGDLAEAGAVGFSDDGSPVGDARIMRSALSYTRPLDLPIIDHCEDPSLAGGVMHEGHVCTKLGLRGVPAAAEENMVARNIFLAELTGGRVHLAHLSTAGSVALLREARAKGLRVTAEVTPHHLTLTHEMAAGSYPPPPSLGTGGDLTPPPLQGGVRGGLGHPYNTNTKVAPPLRTQADVDALAKALADGVIECIATDHAPHTIADKLCTYDEAAFGISCLETCLGSVLSLVHRRIIDVPTLVHRMTWGPAQIIDYAHTGLGTLRPGAPGDVTLFDPDTAWRVDIAKLESKGKNTPLDGQTLRGKVIATVAAGIIVHDSRPEAH